jgi:hypothetical protein
MDAAKKADKVMGVSPQTTSHTVSDVSSDIKKMVTYLRENKVSSLIENRSSPTFEDPTSSGYKKLCSSWWKETLYRTTVSFNCPDPSDEEMQSASDGRENDSIDLDYELFDII